MFKLGLPVAGAAYVSGQTRYGTIQSFLRKPAEPLPLPPACSQAPLLLNMLFNIFIIQFSFL